jgi:UDP-glucuronate decarboxylase
MHPEDGRVVSNLIVQALRGEPLTVYGRGQQTRSFCYVTDMIEALWLLMQTPAALAGPINLGNPEEHSILELAETIIELTRSRSPIVFKDLPYDDPARRRPDISLATAELSWRPSVPLSEGMQQTIDYFDDLLAAAPPVKEAGAPARRAS